MWATTAAVRAGKDYPYATIERAWQNILLLQFHDILPGTSIAWVHQEAERQHEEVRLSLEGVIRESLQALAGFGEMQLSFNASPFMISGVPPMSSGVAVAQENSSVVEVVSGGHTLSNESITVSIDNCGLITSIFDHSAGREVVPEGSVSNLLQVYRDLPTNWDAWEIEPHYMNNVFELRVADKIEVISDYSNIAGLRILRTFGDSLISQEVVLMNGTNVIEITTSVDWRETHKLLKLSFALDVQTSTAMSEIQFGHIERPIHTNTSWDVARFETCAQRWLRVAEPQYGITIANDSTYGHDVTRQHQGDGTTYIQVRESLLRSPVYPDPNTDQGKHTLRTSIKVGSTVADSIEEGFRLNLPLRAVNGAGASEPLVEVSAENVIVEAIKLAEDGSGDVIVRLYEGGGTRTRASVKANFVHQGAALVDLLEKELPNSGTLESSSERETALELRPFKIATLRFRRS
jgi:alpha-mannosidase